MNLKRQFDFENGNYSLIVKEPKKKLKTLWNNSHLALEPNPIVYDGLTYTVTEGCIYAIHTQTGKRIWKHKINGAVTKPVFIKDKIIFSNYYLDCSLHALHVKTGKELWKHRLGTVSKEIKNLPSIKNDLLYIRYGKTVVSISTVNGKKEFSYKLKNKSKKTNLASAKVKALAEMQNQLKRTDRKSLNTIIKDRIWSIMTAHLKPSIEYANY